MPLRFGGRNQLSKFKLNYALRINKRNTGTRLIHGDNNTQVGMNETVAGIDQHSAGVDAQSLGMDYSVVSDQGPIADNEDVYKVRFKKRGMTKLKRLLVRVRRILRAVLQFVLELRSEKFSSDEKLHMLITLHRWNKEDLEDHRRAREDARLFRIHKEQSKLVGRQIVDILTNLGFCHHITKGERKYIKDRVRIAMIDVSPFAYTYHINRVPFGVKKTDMAQDWVSTEIASSIGKKIRHELDLYGLRYTVEVGSTLSIPNFVSFDEFERIPSTMPPLAFFAGQTTNGMNVFRNLADAPHMIIAGQTGGGKSNEANVIICGMIQRNDETVIKLVLFDLKGGVEFDAYYGIPHLWAFGDDKDGIIEYPENIIPALQAIKEECDKRLKLLKKAKVKNIGEFNRGKHPKNRLPYLVCVFDEYTTARKLAGGDVETLLSTIANLSRAAGIHFIIGTQYPKAEILSTLISVNFPWRLAFNMTPAASSSVLGSWNASGLTPTGRAILQTSDGEIMLQTPRITESTIKQIVEDAKNKTNTARVNTVDPKEIIEWVRDNTGTRMDQDSVWNTFKDRITQSQLRNLLQSMENQQFDVNGVLYIVKPGSNHSPRRIERLDGSRLDVDTTRNPQPAPEEPVTRDATEVTPEKESIV